VTTKIVAAGVLIDGRTGGTPPHEAQRRFEKQAEENILDRLSKAKLLAPPGEVDGMCQQIINSLLAANHQPLGEPMQCRLLLPSRLEAFIVNNTIVVSRGFIDVLPDWSPLAFVLAHQLAHNILGHKTVDTKFAFPDVLRIPDAELIGRLHVRHTEEEESEADSSALKMLNQSRYEGGMPQAALFMDSLRRHASGLSSLLEPDFDEHIIDSKRKVRNDPSTRPAEVYDPEAAGQLSALPIGSWLTVNPGTGAVEFSQLSLPPEVKARERGDFTVKAFMPRLQYFGEKTDSPKPIVHRAASRKKQPTSNAKPTVKKNGPSHATGERASLQ
jgi:Peptidase family M48